MTHRVVGLIGNPNVGKTALFNALTRSNAQVGNWPGVTVARSVGAFKAHAVDVSVVDLPGCYACCSYTEEGALDEEEVMRFVLNETVDVFVNVVDGRYLQRHLYLTCQLLEMGLPVVVALNMSDLLDAKQVTIDHRALSAALGCPVVRISAKYDRGIRRLKQVIADHDLMIPPVPPVPDVLSIGHKSLVQAMRQCDSAHSEARLHWLARRWLEGDTLTASVFDQSCRSKLQVIADQVTSQLSESADFLLADQRYSRIQTFMQTVNLKHQKDLNPWSVKLDAVLLHRFFGLPIFFALMYGVFFLAVQGGGLVQAVVAQIADAVCVVLPTQLVLLFFPKAHAAAVLVHGAGVGISTMVTLLPVVMLTTLCLVLLEESGYMTRAAFLVDRLMNVLKLPGRAFIAMILGFGCNVPAISATRTLASAKDRIMTVMMVPFMSCTARLTVYTALASLFFPKIGALVIFGLYVLGFLIGLLTAWVLRLAWGSAQSVPMVMEFPAYQLPFFSGVLEQVKRRSAQFAARATRVIVCVSVALSVLSLGAGQAVLVSIGQGISWLLAPIGMTAAQWPAAIALLTGLLAKEVVVGTLNTLYAQGNLSALPEMIHSVQAALILAGHTIGSALRHGGLVDDGGLNILARHDLKLHMQSSASALAYLSFILLYLPCVSTIAAVQKELSWQWAWWGLLWSTALAYGIAVLVYQVGTLAHHPMMSLVAVSVTTVALVWITWVLIRWVRRIEPGEQV